MVQILLLVQAPQLLLPFQQLDGVAVAAAAKEEAAAVAALVLLEGLARPDGLLHLPATFVPHPRLARTAPVLGEKRHRTLTNLTNQPILFLQVSLSLFHLMSLFKFDASLTFLYFSFPAYNAICNKLLHGSNGNTFFLPLQSHNSGVCVML